MAFEARSRGNINPPAPQPETPYASYSSDLSTTTHPATHPPTLDEHEERYDQPRLPSLSIRSRTSSSASSTSSLVRRKPLPATASPLATRLSLGTVLSTTLEQPEDSFIRSFAVDSPTLYDFPPTPANPFTPAARFSQQPSATLFTNNASADSGATHLLSEHAVTPQTVTSSSPNQTIPPQAIPQGYTWPRHARLASESTSTSASEKTGPWYSDSASTTTPNSATMSIFSSKPTPPHKINGPIVVQRSYSNDSYDSNTTVNRGLPKSPAGTKLGSFFGWGGNVSPASSRSSFSEKSYSPVPPSPHALEQYSYSTDASKALPSIPSKVNKPTAIDVPKANADAKGYFGSAYLQVPLATPTTPVQIEEMEAELKEISSELAASIRREMDLEDLVDRLQSEAQHSSGPGKRTSDYFSDSGVSSVRYGDSDTKQDELDRMIRKTEQDKAQMRLELTTKVQEEKTRRKQLESQIRVLEERASHVELVNINSVDAVGRLHELEATCEDLRHRLSEERQVKDNFEDLLTALKSELQNSHNERDNLRDEIVPQLRARVEGLEAQAAQHEKMTYEQTKMQQELQTLKNENVTLINARRQSMEMQQQLKKFNSIAEDDSISAKPSGGLTRSNSLAHGTINRSRPPSLGRSVSVKTAESRDALAERVKDVELQRDALHNALKNLLERQEHQNRENQKKIRQLEMERDRALSSSPGRLAYDKEVAVLREEINTLRRRADDAIEQKWQCEKGLSGLKMDLDRAEEEIGSLRSLLEENDILIPIGTGERLRRGSRPGSSHVSSESLERAYKDLRAEYANSIERIKKLELSSPKDEDTEGPLKQLEQSLADAISERDFAQHEAASLRQHADSLKQSEKFHLANEQALADELHGSAKRVEELAAQVRQQLAANSTLRQRLAETIERGEKEQKTNAQKITFMQSKLKSLEDQLMAAQQASEDTITRHENEIRDIKENNNTHLQRLKDGMRSTRVFTPNSPLSPMFANSTRSPRLQTTTSGRAMSVSEDSKMDFLRQRVRELETALAEADTEMEEVVSRMNIAQIEVMDLQNEREEAVRETKRLQKKIEEERVRAFEGRFATLSS